MASTGRGLNWKKSEDVALCKAWVSITEDGSIGIYQPGDSFWARVHEKFCANNPGSTEARSIQGIESRYKGINQQCGLWMASVRKANAAIISGISPTDVDYHAHAIFLEDNKPKGRPFKMQHAWQIFKDCPKWAQEHDSPHVRRSSLSSKETVNLGDDDDVSPTPTLRPDGRDKQKAAKKNGKMEESPSMVRTADFIEELVKQGHEVAHRRKEKLKALQEAVKSDKIDRAERNRAREEHIMEMDLSKFTPRKKKYWTNKQDEILESHASAPISDDGSNYYQPSFDDDF